MRNILFILILLVTFEAMCQTPEAFKYQSILRNSAGEEIANTTVNLRISIHEFSPTGIIVYQETLLGTTNNFGLITLSIGRGNPTIGIFNTISWETSIKYVQIEADLAGGTNFTSFGTSELLSVPYALYAKNAEIPSFAAGTAIGNMPFWNGTDWIVSNTNLYHAGENVGIGTSLPNHKLDVVGGVNISKDSCYFINQKVALSTKGNNNVFVGHETGLNNTLGFQNSFLGQNAGQLNITGSQNTFLGGESGSSNTDGSMNSFLGRRAGYLNTNGNENTFIGAYAGQSNQDGFHNSFLGVSTGNSNTTGNENTFLGAHAGYNNNLGNNNTFVGNFAGLINTAGTNNTFIGFNATANVGNLTNASAFGYGAVSTASNSIVIGNSSVVSIGGQVGWSTLSDKRLKHKIQQNKLGLEFILALEPVSYEYKAAGQENIRYSGLIAQDVAQILKKMNIHFSGVVTPQNDSDYYSIRYAEFVIPLINSIQEQQVEITQLKSANESLLKRIEALEQKLTH